MAGKGAGLRADITKGALLEIAEIVLAVSGPYVLKMLVDTLSAGGSDPLHLISLVSLFVVAWAVGSVTSMWRMVYSSRVIDGLTRQLATAAIQSRLPEAASVRDGDSGRMLGLIERLPYSLQVVVDGVIWRALPLLLQLLGSLAIIAGLIPFHYVAILGLVLGGFVAVTWFGAVRHEQNAGAANAVTGAVSHMIGDVLRNARRVILNGALKVEIAGINAQFNAKRHANEQMMWSLMTMSVFQYGVVGLGLLLLLTMGGLDVVSQRMTVGEFVLLQAYAFRLALPLSGLGFTLSQAAISLANIGDVFDLSVPTTEPASDPLTVKSPASIALRNVSFQYGPDLPGVHGITADIVPGSFVVIVGANGSGKSTLAQLLAGILEASEGSVLINGREMNTVARADRHRHVLYVPQFIGLFNRTLGANAMYPPSMQSQSDIGELLRGWRFYEADREINFGAPVGEHGERLSGGQIQKLELARLTGVRVPAVILDESTSALDPTSEVEITESLRRAYGTRTTLIMITHEQRLAEAADEVLFMSGGKLIAKGSHNELFLENSGYALLWNNQD
jgi:ABC-type multidrug transport system fused ATPase/permease subunit